VTCLNLKAETASILLQDIIVNITQVNHERYDELETILAKCYTLLMESRAQRKRRSSAVPMPNQDDSEAGQDGMCDV
jgi:hypothetical protein